MNVYFTFDCFWYLLVLIRSQPQGFPNGINLWGDKLGKISKSCKKIAKSTFLGQNSEGDMEDKPIFWVVGDSLPVLPPPGQILQPGVAYKSVSYKKACNIVLYSSSKHEEITLPHECIFVFCWYFIGADLPKNIAKSERFQKEIKKGRMAIQRVNFL